MIIMSQPLGSPSWPISCPRLIAALLDISIPTCKYHIDEILDFLNFQHILLPDGCYLILDVLSLVTISPFTLLLC